MEASSHGTEYALMEQVSPYFGLKLSVLVFSITEQFSVTLQGVNTNANDCLVAVHATIQGLTRHRIHFKE